ncbi:hypothetical protein ACIPW4_17335 [Pseudomonas sp. NPDC089996]|uniref:hypothetical protein n=1 Tax=Pseudomonas sp. NPDC089996 TaxID=3364474 RepID=UPI0038063C4F
MSQPSDTAAWADGHSFLGQIYLRKDHAWVPVHTQAIHYDLSFGVDVESESGWLQTGGSAPAAVFQFRFHSRASERLHYRVSLAADSTRRLGAVKNGYLGLYSPDEAANFWKLQPLEWAPNQLRCLFRDHLGHQVKTEPIKGKRGAYLTIGAGEMHEYLIKRAH